MMVNVLLPTTTIGSFPKSKELKKLRKAYDEGKVGKEVLEAKEYEETVDWIRFQEKIGLDYLVDGELYRGDMIAYFAENLQGCDVSGLVRSFENFYYRRPVIGGKLQGTNITREKVRWTQPITVDRWRFAQSLTTRPVKAILTGPYTMLHWSYNMYNSKEQALEDLAKAIRPEVLALINAGAKNIQIDEPGISDVPQDFLLAKKAIDHIIRGLEGQATFETHFCFGHYNQIYPRVLDLPFQVYSFETANRGFPMYPLIKKSPFTKTLCLGTFDVHDETNPRPIKKEDVKALILRGLELVPPERLRTAPDCGLKTARSIELTRENLRIMVEATREVRDSYKPLS